MLFSLANLSRFLSTPAEDALRQANKRFTSRFQHMEAKLDAQGRKFDKVPLDELNALWEEAKREEQQAKQSEGELKRGEHA